MTRRRYCAFISYRHADNSQEGRRWAEWLHRALERYTVPPDLVGTPNLRGEPVPSSLYPIFRDEDELPANADLATGIRAALEISDHLVVLCSPRSAVSPWVRKEVREFKELGRSNRILAVMIAGEPNADDPAKVSEGILREEECFCGELRFGVRNADGTIDWAARTEPLAADLRPGGMRAEGFVSADAYREHLTLHSSLPPEKIAAHTDAYRQRLDLGLLKVIAGLLGVPLNQLVDRDAAHRAELARRELERSQAEAAQMRSFNRRLAIAGAVALVLALLAGWFWWQAGQKTVAAVKAQDEEKVQRRLAEERGNKLQISEKTLEKKLHEASMADYNVAVQCIEKDGKWHEGVAHLARALKWEPDNALAAARLYSTLSVCAPQKQTWPRLVIHHDKRVQTVKFSPSGKRIIATCQDGTLVVWDATNGEVTGDSKGHEAFSISGRRSSPDGTRIVTWSMNGTARVQTANNEPIGAPLQHEGIVSAAQFSPDGTRILTASYDQTARMWDAFTGKPIGEPLRHEEAVMSAQFSPDGAHILTVTLSGIAREWDASNSKPINEPLPHNHRVNDVQFSPDGARILTAGEDGAARLWDAFTGRPVGEPLRHDQSVTGAAFSPDGTQIVTVSKDNIVRVWELMVSKSAAEPLRDEFSATRVQFSPNGTLCLVNNLDGYMRVRDTSNARMIRTLSQDPWSRVLFSVDGSRSVTFHNKYVHFQDAFSFERSDPIRHERRVLHACLSRFSSQITTITEDGSIQVWDVSANKFSNRPLIHDVTLNSAQFSPDGTRILTVSSGGTAEVWDARTGKSIGEGLHQPSAVRHARFSPDGRRMATAGDGKDVVMWDSSTLKNIGEPLHHDDVVSGFQFGPDGTRIVTHSLNTARVWDARTGKPIGEPMNHEDVITEGRFSPDGTRIVTTSRDKTARIWDAASGKQLGEPLGHLESVFDADFSPDGTRIVTASSDRLGLSSVALIWDVSKLTRTPVPVPEWMLARARAIAGLTSDADGELKAIPNDDRRAALLEPVSGDDDWSRLARWLALPANERTLTPDSKFTCRQIAERERDSGGVEGPESALHYDPTVPLARIMLADSLQRKDAGKKQEERDPSVPARVKFLREYDVKHLPPDPAICQRAAELLRKQGQGDLAQQALARAGKK